MRQEQFSDYIVYVDESGDHGLSTLDQNYPVFVLSFCVFQKSHYAEQVAPALQKLKFKHFGHDLVVLHNREIRKAEGDFSLLNHEPTRAVFLDDLNGLVETAPFVLISCVIHKSRLKVQYAKPLNPYNLALVFCMERTFAYLRDLGQLGRTTTICLERRGRTEDEALALRFRRIIQGDNNWGPMPFEIRFASKDCNSAGLQMADLVSHPIGRYVLNPTQENRAYRIIERKFRRSLEGRVEGYGLKVFP